MAVDEDRQNQARAAQPKARAAQRKQGPRSAHTDYSLVRLQLYGS